MKRRFIALALALGLCLGLAIPASAYDMGHVQQPRIVACGKSHTAVVKGDGTLWTTGENYRCQLGDGTTQGRLTPVKVLDNVASVTCGEYQTAAIRTDGTLWTWGLTNNNALPVGGGDTLNEEMGTMNQSKPLKVMDNVAAVACGYYYTAVIKTDGTLWTWGNNNEGQLGNGIIGRKSNGEWYPGKPVEPVETVFKVMDNVVAVACGDSHTAAIKSDGTLWVWGYNGRGTVGDGTTDTRSSPVKVLDSVVAVACGDNHTAAIRKDGTLWMWGSNWSGQLGKSIGNSSTPAGDIYQTTPVQVMDHVAAVSCGDNHTAAIKTDGSLWMWGWNSDGQIGNGVRGSQEKCLTPVKVLEGVTAVSCGQSHTAAVCSDGTLWAWGDNNDGQLGNGGSGNDSYETQETIFAGLVFPAKTYCYQTVPAKVMDLSPSSGTASPASPSAAFTDVADNAYYAAPVAWAVEKGITTGTTATTFSPNNTCTTAQILTFLWRAKGQIEPTIANPFTDVAESAYYYKAALWAYENGMVSGTAFGGGTPCTRSATVTYLWKLAGSPEAAPSAFTDVAGGAEYAPAVAWAVEKGVTGGTTATTFSPDNTCTRGQIVTFLYRDMAQ